MFRISYTRLIEQPVWPTVLGDNLKIVYDFLRSIGGDNTQWSSDTFANVGADTTKSYLDKYLEMIQNIREKLQQINQEFSTIKNLFPFKQDSQY